MTGSSNNIGSGDFFSNSQKSKISLDSIKPASENRSI